jgi:hypothetical protein
MVFVLAMTILATAAPLHQDSFGGRGSRAGKMRILPAKVKRILAARAIRTLSGDTASC